MSLKIAHPNNLVIKHFLLNAVFFGILFTLTPMTSDDVNFWMLRITGFHDILAYSLPYGNGRLLGNIGVFYLVEYKFLRVLIKTLVMASISVFLPLALNLKSKTSYWTALLLILSVSPSIFSQTYTWTSGFQNYVPSMFFLLLGILLVDYTEKKSAFVHALICIAVFICGISMQLYVEHSSCINFFFLMCYIIYRIICKQRVSPALISLFLGVVVGSFFMIYIPAHFYTNLNEVDSYRNTVFNSGLSGFVVGVAKNLIKLIGMYSENTFALLALSGLQIFLIQKNRCCFKKYYSVFLACISISTVCLVCYHLLSFSFWYGKLAVFESLMLAASSIVYLLSFLLSGIILLLHKRSKVLFTAYTMFLFSIISIAPLAFVEPIWPRCVLHAYMFLAASVLVLLEYVLSSADHTCLQSIANRISSLITITTMVCFLVLFADINRMYNIRETTISEQIASGETQIDYFELPSDYMYDYWLKDYYEDYYSMIHGSRVHINIVPPDVWFNTHYY